MREKLQRFMWGRYGNDNLNQFLLSVAFIALIISFFGGGLFYFVATSCYGSGVFSHVFPQYQQTFGGESAVPEAADEGQGDFYKKEKGMGTT